MDRHSESVLLGFVLGLLGGIVVGVFSGQISVFVLAGVIGGIVLGSVVDLPVLLRRPEPEVEQPVSAWDEDPGQWRRTYAEDH